MTYHYTKRRPWLLPLLALLFSAIMFWLFPTTGEAHAILLNSDPVANAQLASAPDQVRLDFSEDLNPTSSTITVQNVARARADANDAHVVSGDVREMTVSLQKDLPPGAYLVLWTSQSSADGHVLHGSFLFYVLDATGKIPGGQGSGAFQDAINSSGASGQLDGAGLFSFFMIALAEMGVIFWVGAQLWHAFVLQLVDADSSTQETIDNQAERRFWRSFAFPTLLLLLLANLGVLLGQGLTVTQGNLAQALPLLGGLIRNGQFGTYWLLRQVTAVLGLVLTVIIIWKPQRSRVFSELLAWANLLLALSMLVAMALSGHAASTAANIMIYAVLIDWLHLLAASLWIGGMFYLALVYLPTLRAHPLIERSRVLLSTLAHFSLLAIAGVIIMAATGPFNAAVRVQSFNQLTSTAYGRTLIVKIALIVGLLLTSGWHVYRLRPALARVLKRYTDAESVSAQSTEESAENAEAEEKLLNNAPPTKQLEARVSARYRRLTRVLRWESLLGVAVLLCVGLLNVFAGTLQPATTSVTRTPTGTPTPATKPFDKTIKTDDGKFTLQVHISPMSFGNNTFTVHVLDSKGTPVTNVGVSVYTTMLDMDMGTDALNLQPDGKGGFTGEGAFGMGGDWQLRFQVRTAENTLHETKIKVVVPF